MRCTKFVKMHVTLVSIRTSRRSIARAAAAALLVSVHECCQQAFAAAACPNLLERHLPYGGHGIGTWLTQSPLRRQWHTVPDALLQRHRLGCLLSWQCLRRQRLLLLQWWHRRLWHRRLSHLQLPPLLLRQHCCLLLLVQLLLQAVLRIGGTLLLRRQRRLHVRPLHLKLLPLLPVPRLLCLRELLIQLVFLPSLLLLVGTRVVV